jgi:hypothetical protein
MTSDEREHSEQSAAGIVARKLEVPVVRRDGKGAPPGTHDFEMLFDNTRPVPLEVTRSTDGPHRRFWNQITHTDWQLEGMSASWWVSVGYSYPPAKDLRAALVQVLPTLEALGIENFDMNSEDEFGHRPNPSAPWAPLASVYVRRGRVVEMDPESPYVYIGNSGSYATGPEVINDLAAIEAANNAAKLGANGHLFIWVDSLDHQSWVGMDLRTPTDRPGAALPDGITVWVARRPASGEWEPDRLWIVRPGEAWVSLLGT